MFGNPPNFHVQKASESDALELAQTHVKSWHETYTGLVPQKVLSRLSIDARAKQWHKMLSRPHDFNNITVFLTRLDDVLIGFGACNDQRSEKLLSQGFDAEISAIYVLNSYQRLGVGRALIQKISSQLTCKSFQGISLWVLDSNRNARNFYEHLGGKVVAEKSEKRAEATLQEVAYGWRNLATLT